jgi:hypothetical protein
MKNNQQPVCLVIKLNENPTPNDCPLCSAKTNPNIGAQLFLDNTEQTVCFDCGLLYSPILASLVNMADAARFFIEYEQNFGQEWEKERRATARKSTGALVTFPQERRQSA